MYYSIELLLNTADPYTPIENVKCQSVGNDFSKAYIKTILDNWVEGMKFCDYDNRPFNISKNCVMSYILDIFNNYHRLWIMIRAEDFEKCEETLAYWIHDYILDCMKECWLKDQMKDFKTWFIEIVNKGVDTGQKDYIVETCREIDEADNIGYDEVRTMMDGVYIHIPTELSHIVSAWEYGPGPVYFSHNLIVKAKDEIEATEVANDFIRLYLEEPEDEYEPVHDA